MSEKTLIVAYAAQFQIREDRAAEEILELFAEDQAHQEQMDEAGVSKLRHVELGKYLMGEMMKDGAAGPAATVYKALGNYLGMEQNRVQLEATVTDKAMPGIIRERIAQLMQSESIQERAKQAGVDLDAMASDDEGDQYRPAKLLAPVRQPQTNPIEATEPTTFKRLRAVRGIRLRSPEDNVED